MRVSCATTLQGPLPLSHSGDSWRQGTGHPVSNQWGSDPNARWLRLKNATHRADCPDPTPRKERLLAMTRYKQIERGFGLLEAVFTWNQTSRSKSPPCRGERD